MKRFGILASLVVITATSVGQAPMARAEMGRAASLLKQDPEAAAEHLRRAWLFGQRIEDGRERRLIQAQAADTLRDLDRNGLRAARVQNDVLDDLREVASLYSAVGWFATAERHLLAAEVLMPEAVVEDLRVLRQRRAEIGRAPDAPAPGANDLLVEWFEGGELPYLNEGWKLDDEGLRSPPCEGKGRQSTTMLLSNRPFDGGGRVRFQLRMGSMGRVGFAFAVRRGVERPTYHLFSVFYEKTETWLRSHRVTEDEAIHVETRAVPISVEQQRGWVEVEIVLTGTAALMSVGSVESPLLLTVPGGVDGRLGFYITGDSPLRDPVHVRKLQLECFTPVK